MSGEWTHSLFGCFNNVGLSIITCFAPCYTFGKNAEAMQVGDCLPCALVFMCVPIADCYFWYKVRSSIRERRGIAGSCLGDLLTMFCCGCCALVQEAQEIEAMGAGNAIARQ